QLFDPPPPQPALSVFLPRAHHKLRAMQIHSQIPFHRRLLLLLLGSGVDAALRRSPNSHSSSYWPYGDASIAGLTNLCVEVVPPHGTSPACNLSAPELLSWSLPPQNRYPIHAISVVLNTSVTLPPSLGRLHGPPPRKPAAPHEPHSRTPRLSRSRVPARARGQPEFQSCQDNRSSPGARPETTSLSSPPVRSQPLPRMTRGTLSQSHSNQSHPAQQPP